MCNETSERKSALWLFERSPKIFVVVGAVVAVVVAKCGNSWSFVAAVAFVNVDC